MLNETLTRVIRSENAHKCAVCGEIAATGCTDVKQVDDKWIESPWRYGCIDHPAKSILHFADGTQMTAKQYEHQQ